MTSRWRVWPRPTLLPFLISTACTLGSVARATQSDVAALLRAGRERQAVALIVRSVLPWAGLLGQVAGWSAGTRILGTPGARADLLATLEAEEDFDLALCASTIAAPTLIIGGERDRFYDTGLFHRTAELIADSHLLLVPRRGHLSVMQSRRARAHVEGFLGSPAVAR